MRRNGTQGWYYVRAEGQTRSENFVGETRNGNRALTSFSIIMVFVF